MNNLIRVCSTKVKNNQRLLILACSVLEKEIRQFQNGQMEFKFLDYGLHQTPEQMAEAIQSEIDKSSEGDYDGIVLGYGLCSNGIVGITSKKHRLIVPRIHDCISLFLGSVEVYQNQSKEYPGTYYLTPGWIEKGQTPISKFESYAQSYGEETARWVLYEEMKHYTRIAFIDTGVYPSEPYKKIARENAKFLGVTYEELRGSPELFKRMLQGPWDNDFLIVERNQSIKQEFFLDL